MKLAITLTFCVLLLTPAAAGQTQKKNTTPRAEKIDKETETIESATLLSGLLEEAKRVDNEQQRVFLIGEVANAYWTIDNKRARELFSEAFDLALEVKPSKETRLDPVSEVLGLAARRDVSLATALLKRAQENERSARSFSVATEMVDSNLEAAIDFAKAGASYGPSWASIRFIFKLAEKRPLEAATVYESYLRGLGSSQQNRSLRRVLWLAGYPQGFGEAYGDGETPAELVGFAGMRIPDLAPQPRLISAYLNVANESIMQQLNMSALARGPEKDQLNSLALFALDYLQEAVQLYRPDLVAHWASLRQRVLSVVTPEGRVESQVRLKSILEVRARVSEYSTSEEYATGSAQKEVERIERITGGCQRDEAYAQLVFGSSFAKDFNTARQVIEKVESLTLREALIQLVTFDEASIAIKNGSLVDAVRLIEKISAKDLRALQYLRVAAVAAKAPDKSMAIDALAQARTLAESVEPREQAGILISVASVFSEFDAVEATNAFNRAINSMNSVKGELPTTFAVMRRVPFGCDDKWYGSSESGSTRNLYDSLAFLSRKITVNEALILARNIEDRTTRIRAQLSVINALQR